MTEYANTTDSVKTVENEAASAKYWHDMYVATSQMAQDYAAKVGADIKRLENELQVSDQSGYEKGFVEGAQHQMKSSVDKAVNRMAQPEQEPLTEWLVCPKCSYKSPYTPIKAKTLAEDAERITKQTRAALAQPARKWIGLNWGDLPEEWVGDTKFLTGARWAEQILEEKNT